MPRSTGRPASRSRRKKILDQAKGYRGSRHRLIKTAKQAIDHAGVYAYRDRKVRKREFRRLWIARINAAARANGITYSKLMAGLKMAGIDINRKMLSEIAIHDAAAFTQLAETAKSKVEATA